MIIAKKLHDTELMKNPHGLDARNLYNAPSAKITVITLQPHESLRPHITPVDVAFYVLRGQGIVDIGDHSELIGPDTLVESPKGIAHCWHNESDEPLVLMVVKAPRPTEKTIFTDEMETTPRD